MLAGVIPTYPAKILAGIKVKWTRISELDALFRLNIPTPQFSDKEVEAQSSGPLVIELISNSQTRIQSRKNIPKSIAIPFFLWKFSFLTCPSNSLKNQNK